MKLRFVSMLLVCVLSAIPGARPAAAGTAAAGLQTFAERAAAQPLLQRTGGGCGWDYPCPPEPEFGRRSFHSDHVTIRNNYGPVNVYPGVSRPPYSPPQEEPAYCSDDPCQYGCGGYPCTEKCGTLCWLRRLRKGYCGHGCESYLEQARTEADEKAAWKAEQVWKKKRKAGWMYEKRLECAPPGCVRDYGEPPPPYYYDRPRARNYRSRSRPPRRKLAKPDLTPRKRFRGPEYPPK